jgi:hypothetical protein
LNAKQQNKESVKTGKWVSESDNESDESKKKKKKKKNNQPNKKPNEKPNTHTQEASSKKSRAIELCGNTSAERRVKKKEEAKNAMVALEKEGRQGEEGR